MSIRINLIALAVCTAGSAIAQEAPVIQASAGITNLRFEYSDLRPDDGMAASLTITSPRGTSAMVTGGVPSTAIGLGTSETSSMGTRGHILDGKSYEIALVNNEATFTKGADSAVANLAVQPSTIGKSTYVTTMEEWGEQTVGGGYFASSMDDVYGLALTLGAGTELKISGSIFSTLSLKTDSVIGLTQGQEILVSASNSVTVALQPKDYFYEDLSDVLGEGRYPFEQIRQSVEQTVSPLGSGPDNATSASDSRTFEFVARNSRDTAVTVLLYGRIYSTGYWESSNANLQVPEPSTWALMLSGLCLAVWRVRRRPAAS
ncbi:MAG: PEP-CTERM sorting domain-containing protein [Gammaproteobacteria bacterium]|jgi:hypothetical protein|nr:PEP-CTERM sorting domain-containing protein [Gammaproteobacteria bacterium]